MFDTVVEEDRKKCTNSIIFILVTATAGSDETIHLWKFFDKEKKQRKKAKNVNTSGHMSFNLENFIR